MRRLGRAWRLGRSLDGPRARDLWITRRKRFFNKALAQLIFIDETSTNTKLTKRTGWSPRGKRYRTHAPFGSWKTQTFIAGLRCHGLTAPWIVNRPMNGNLTDAEWGLAQPLIPPAKRGGRRREVNVREVANGLLYVLSTGCQWRAVPKDLPPKSTLFNYFDLWNWDGTLGRIHQELYVKCREAMGREASPTAAIIDSQSVKGAEKGGVASTRAGMMRGRRSKARSAISSSIR